MRRQDKTVWDKSKEDGIGATKVSIKTPGGWGGRGKIHNHSRGSLEL